MQRMIFALLLSLALVLLAGPKLIPVLRKMKFGQTIYELGPQSHKQKQGTPTMGGLMMAGAVLVACLVCHPAQWFGWQDFMLALLAVSLLSMLVGFADDYIKVVKKRNLGLKAKQKMLGQILIAIVTMIVGTRVLGIDTTIWIPIADVNVDIGVGYYFLVLFVLVGTSNAVNLTDGLDGLASGTVAIASGAYALVCYMTGHYDLAIFSVAMMMA